MALPVVLEDALCVARTAVVGLLLLGVATLGLWVQGRSCTVLIAIRLITAGLTLVVIVGIGALVAQMPGGERFEALAQVIALAVVAGLLVAWWVRAIRLRVVLCEDHQRELLFVPCPGPVVDACCSAVRAALVDVGPGEPPAPFSGQTTGYPRALSAKPWSVPYCPSFGTSIKTRPDPSS